ncbi:MAG TPA: ABC transporter permease [Gemmatimonadaceae bacterium]|nr:ABC transporter permease [Gemmatimonadaceae bacterium]
MRLRRSIALSLRALFAHRVRAVLAVASVSTGTAATIVTSAIGAGADRDIQWNIRSMGVNLLVVRPAQVKRSAARKELSGTVTTLGVGDYQAIAELPNVAEIAPGIEAGVRVKSGIRAVATRMLGTTPAFPAVRRFWLRSGRFFDADDDRAARRVVVLGARVADALFAEDPVGTEIRIRGVPFDVIGVLAPKGVLADGDEDDQVLVPIRTALRRMFNTTSLNAVYVSVNDVRSVTATKDEIGAELERRHRPTRDGSQDFEVQDAARFFALQRQMADALDNLTTGLAFVALIVGGVGVMALMLLSVRERTSEIGLRMAVGATPRDIVVQFLLESTILAFGGWMAGLVLGAGGAAAVAATTSWRVAVPLPAFAGTLGTAMVIGLGFGAVPARRAALVPPMRALLTE